VRRVGIGATTGSANGALVSLSAGVTPRLALILTGGAQLAEVVSGVPAARVGGISLRYQLAGARTNTPTQSTGPVERARSPFDTRVEPLPTGGAVVTVRVNAPADATVELMGTHNEWAIVPLVRVNDAFEMRIQLPRGSHRLAVRINGGEWRAPQGLARARDDMGGEVGIVIVP
ncbi:MAG: glycogen-binding domain-containing protein, partial [Gemmatimonas sp.]